MAQTRTFHTKIYCTIDISQMYISCAVTFNFTLFVRTSVLADSEENARVPFTNCHSCRIYQLVQKNYISLRSRTLSPATSRRNIESICRIYMQKSRARYACDVCSIDCPLSHEFERGNLRRVFYKRETVSVISS